MENEVILLRKKVYGLNKSQSQPNLVKTQAADHIQYLCGCNFYNVVIVVVVVVVVRRTRA